MTKETKEMKASRADMPEPEKVNLSETVPKSEKGSLLEKMSKIIAIVIPGVNLIRFAVALFLSNDNEIFYGIDRRYFYSKSNAAEILLLLVALMAVFMLTLSIPKFKPSFSGRWSIALAATAFIGIFFQEVMGLSLVFQYASGHVSDAAGLILLVIIVASSAEMSLYMSIDERILRAKTKKLLIDNSIMIVFALAVYAVTFISVPVTTLLYQSEAPEKKTVYEMTEDGDAIVSEYNGDYVVMHCREEGGLLVIDRGTCYMKEITGTRVTRKEFNEVICK